MLIRDVFTRNIGVKLLSLVLAIVLWYMAVGRERAEVGLNVPLELVNFPKDMVISNQIPDGVSVRIRGSVAQTRQMADRKLRFSLNLAGAKKGPNKFSLLADNLNIPRGLEITHMAPTEVVVELEGLATKTVSLLPVIKGEPVAGYIIEDIILNPKQVEVRGPESYIEKLNILWTEPVDVTTLKQSTKIVTRPSLPNPALSLVDVKEIEADLKIGEKIVTRAFNDVLVQPIRPDTEKNKFELSPDKVDLTIRGPLNTMTGLVTGEAMKVRVNLAGLEPGKHERLLIVAIPPNMEVVKVDPKVIRIEVFEEEEEEHDRKKAFWH